MKNVIILGTSPEIIKMNSILKECGKHGIDYHILNIGQHYSYEMDKTLSQEIQL